MKVPAGYQIHNFISSSVSGTVINYRYGSGSGEGWGQKPIFFFINRIQIKYAH